MKIAFTGYYGMANYGDDLFVLASTYGASNFWGVKPVIIGSKVNGIDANFKVKKFNKLYLGHNIFSKAYRMFIMLTSFIENDKVVLAGGSVISSDTSNTMRKFQHYLAKKNISKISAIGVSVGPFTNNEDYENARKFINDMEYISVRDLDSYNILKNMGIKIPYILGRDIAGVLPISSKSTNILNNNEFVLGVSLCNYESYTNGNIEIENARNKAIIEGIKKFALSRKNIKVKILVLNTHPVLGDFKISKELQSYLNKFNISNELIYHNGNPTMIWNEIANCSAFLSVRLHGAITAYLNNVPFVLVEYHKKCSAFLDDIGFNKTLRIKNNIDNSDYIKDILNKITKFENLVNLTPEEYNEQAIKTFTCAPWGK